jgi:hypothetical protein
VNNPIQGKFSKAATVHYWHEVGLPTLRALGDGALQYRCWFSGLRPILILTAVVWLAMVFLDLHFRNEHLPWGIVSLEIPLSAEHAWMAMSAWVPSQARAALLSVQLDYIFIGCYVYLLCRWGGWLKAGGRQLGVERLRLWLSGSVNVMFTLAVIAGACDVVENLGLGAMLAGVDAPELQQTADQGYLVHTAFFRAYLITKSCAIAKFVCLGVLLFLGAIGSVWFLLAGGQLPNFLVPLYNSVVVFGQRCSAPLKAQGPSERQSSNNAVIKGEATVSSRGKLGAKSMKTARTQPASAQRQSDSSPRKRPPVPRKKGPQA